MTMEQVGTSIVEGGIYLYVAGNPKGCKGNRYKVHRFVLDVPSYQKKVLVESLDGKDAGLWFTCSLANFAVRYKLHDERKGD